MEKQFNWDDLKQFTGSGNFFRHWGNPLLFYTEGVQYLANQTNSYWLVNEIGYELLPKLLKRFKDWFYCIQFQAYSNETACITVSNGNGRIWLKRKIKWTDFPITEQPITFYLCQSGRYSYCFMLASEY